MAVVRQRAKSGAGILCRLRSPDTCAEADDARRGRPRSNRVASPGDRTSARTVTEGMTDGTGARVRPDTRCRSRIRPHVGLTTYDAKDPATSFPPIEPLRPPAGAPNVLIMLIDDAGFGVVERVRRSVRHADRRAARRRRAEVQPVPHDRVVLADRAGAAHRPQPPHGRAWAAITEIATSAPGNSSVRPIDAAPLAEILKLNGYSTAQFGKCHEVPVWETSPMGPFRQWPTGSGLRVLLRLHRRRDEPVLPGALRGHDAGRAAEDPGGGLPLHRGHDRQGDRAGCASRSR